MEIPDFVSAHPRTMGALEAFTRRLAGVEVFWVGRAIPGDGVAGLMAEAKAPPGSDARSSLDTLLGFVEVVATLEGLQLAGRETAQARQVFVFSPEAVSSRTLRQGQFYRYGRAVRG